MPSRIEDYALIGDLETAALVARDGSIDWLCVPRFDSGACFAALLGTPEQGRFLLAPTAPARVTRRYRGHTLVLETTFETDEGAVCVVDAMPVRATPGPQLVRSVVGLRGTVRMECELILRFDYGSIVPWVTGTARGLVAVAGPDRLVLETPVALVNEGFRTRASFDVAAGERVPFALAWSASHLPETLPDDPDVAIAATERFWERWIEGARVVGPHADLVRRSLVTLKALTYAPTGAIVAAPTTSLPECAGGVRNWDYRYSWLRDSTFALYALLDAGYRDEARAWYGWLARAVAGLPAQAQIVYAVDGARRMTEIELDLPGHLGSRPVRIGNAAARQAQHDVYGEVLDTMHQARRLGLDPGPRVWAIEQKLVERAAEVWREPDHGIWETRGPAREHTFSKVMAWVALDRGVRAIEAFGREGPLEDWRRVRDEIHADVCRNGVDPERGCFVQQYGAKNVDASALRIVQVGFLPPDDPRILATIRAVESDLLAPSGLVRRYRVDETDDGVPGRESHFVACSFWLVDAYVLTGRLDEARRLFDRVVALCNDVGLLAEEYAPVEARMLGNFPQALSHIALVNSARNLAGPGPAEHRRSGAEGTRAPARSQ